MTALGEHIAKALERVRNGDLADSEIEVAATHPLPTQLGPEELYALVGFVRHERRQLWVGHLVESRLRGQGAELASMGAFAHPEKIAQSGDVPAEPGWKYFFHGRGCCFTHSDGTSIDVDFADDGTALDIDPYFFTHYLQSLPAAEWCERQLKRSDGFDNAWQFDLARLAELKLIRREWRFRLTDDGRRLGELLEPVLEQLEAASAQVRCWLLCALGDLRNAAAHFPAGVAPDFIATALLAQTQRRVAALNKFISGSDDSRAKEAIAALGLLGPEHALDAMESALQIVPVTSRNHAALGVLKHWDAPTVTERLAETLKAMTSTSFLGRVSALLAPRRSMEPERPRLGLVVGLAEELMRRFQPSSLPSNLRHTLVSALRADCFAMEDDAGFLLFQLEPDLGRSKLAKSLTSSVPITRSGAACFLALIGDARCIETLIHSAGQSPEHGGHEAACALSLMPDAGARTASENWSQRNDGYEEAEGQETELMGRVIRTWTMEEVMRSNLREDMRYSYERTQQRFGGLLKRWRDSSLAARIRSTA